MPKRFGMVGHQLLGVVIQFARDPRRIGLLEGLGLGRGRRGDGGGDPALVHVFDASCAPTSRHRPVGEAQLPQSFEPGRRRDVVVDVDPVRLGLRGGLGAKPAAPPSPSAATPPARNRRRLTAAAASPSRQHVQRARSLRRIAEVMAVSPVGVRLRPDGRYSFAARFARLARCGQGRAQACGRRLLARRKRTPGLNLPFRCGDQLPIRAKCLTRAIP